MLGANTMNEGTCPNCRFPDGEHVTGCVYAPPEDRPSLLDDGMNPKGRTCSKCREREATTAWGDAMTINHGGGEWRCDVCAYTEQLVHARNRAKVIPELERKLTKAKRRAGLL